MMLRIAHEKLADGRIVISASDFEDMIDIMQFDAARAEAGEVFPVDLVKRLIAGESPVRVWREYRGFIQTGLAERAGVSQTTIAEVESGRKKGSIDTLKAIAAALSVDLDDIV